MRWRNNTTHYLVRPIDLEVVSRYLCLQFTESMSMSNIDYHRPEIAITLTE